MRTPWRAIAWVGVVAGLVVATPGSASASACAGGDAVPASISLDEYDAAVLCLLNAERADAGLDPLAPNDKLARAAERHSRSMKEHHYFSHDGRGGSSFSARIGRTGYKRGAQRWLVGENLAAGTMSLATPAAIVSAWMHSEEHRRNILEPAFRDIGIGTVRGASSLFSTKRGVTITTDFGWRV